MNGAQALLKTLVDAGFDTCFANPGTSEMSLVYEIGLQNDVRAVLCLQENVVTGAADGYWRMRGKPAFTLLHVGSGFANGIANLHNTGRANSAVLNVVGANASYHQPNYPEHEFVGGNIADVASVVSHWCREARNAPDMAALAAIAVAEVRKGCGKVGTLIAPTQCHWEDAGGATAPMEVPPPLRVSSEAIAGAAAALSGGKKAVILIGANALRDGNIDCIARVAKKCGATLFTETFPARMSRGVGTVPVPVMPYILEMGQMALAGVEVVIAIGANEPVSTFAYENKALSKMPPGCELITLATPDHDIGAAIAALEEAVGSADTEVVRVVAQPAEVPSGPLTPQAIGRSIRLQMPANSILVDEGATGSLGLVDETQLGPRHDYLYSICGGAIGGGLPVTLGASIACPDRKVITLQADGSGMYTNQALWSLAREKCDALIVILKNDAYAILNVEMARVNPSDPTESMQAMMNLDHPSIDWVQLARSMGVQAAAASNAEEFHRLFGEAVNRKGPFLIEATIEQDIQGFVELLRAVSAGAH